MDSLEKLKALLQFLGPQLSKEYTGLIRDLREQVKKEKALSDSEIDQIIVQQILK